MELRLGGPFVWSTPDDAARWIALLLGLAVAFGRLRASDRGLRLVERCAPFAAAALSAGYIAFYLRGGPRIIDATAYYLQGRALASGALALPTSEAELAIVGRFLVRTDWHGPAASVIFPPGWPAVLAIGFWLGAPLAVGPAIAAALCVATARLARLAMVESGYEHVAGRAGAAASVMSVGCATLRYHTADTMSHGWAGLCFAVALATGWTALRRGSFRLSLVAGLAFGWLFSTRPPTALALAATVVIAGACGWLPRPANSRRMQLALGASLGALLPLALWFFHQHAATGSWLSTAQHRYYALSDGPNGCFRYGFGEGIGCLGEHGDFVRHNLPDGYGAVAALGTTGRRLLLHVTDVFNFGPLALLVLWGVRLKRPITGMLATAVLTQVLAYAPFYFDGNYPGGGARMFADILPLEHVLAAIAVTTGLGERSERVAHVDCDRAWQGRAKVVLVMMLFGFALGTGRDHAALRDREGGRPMFDDATLAAVAIDPKKTLIFIETDHGFNLGHGPGRLVMRTHDDDLDRLTWEALGRPEAFRYRYRFEDGGVDLLPVAFDTTATANLALKLEGESLWPPVEQVNGWAWPSWQVPPCASRGHGLEVLGSATTRVTVRMPLAASGRVATPSVARFSTSGGHALRLLVDGNEVHVWRPTPHLVAGECTTLEPTRIPPAERTVELELEGANFVLDAVELSKLH